MSLTSIDNSRTDLQTDRSTEPAPIITARQLSFSFREGDFQKQILFDVDLDIRRGEMVFLTGPSGSGKTTLLTLIGGLRTVQQGQLSVLGEQLFGASLHALVSLRRRIGFVFQTHNLFDFLSVRQNVELAFELHPNISPDQVRHRSEEIVHAVGLGQHIDQHPARLSVGQRQRVAIARALVTRPELVLADEPTAALDRSAGRAVVDLLKQLTHEQSCPILMVTHDNRILDDADRIVRMEDGRILSQSGLVIGDCECANSGGIAVMEGYPLDVEVIDILVEETGLPRAAFRAMEKHTHLDPQHRDDLMAALDALPLQDEHHEMLCVSAFTTIETASALYHEVAASLPSTDESLLGAASPTATSTE